MNHLLLPRHFIQCKFTYLLFTFDATFFHFFDNFFANTLVSGSLFRNDNPNKLIANKLESSLLSPDHNQDYILEKSQDFDNNSRTI